MIRRAHLSGDVASEAVYSDCGHYRYGLTRRWEAGATLLYVLLNPSTATEVQNDPTVERCERRARALGYGAFAVVNLFAYRATDPRQLRRVADPVGPENDAALDAAAGAADQVLCGWGLNGRYLGRGAQVLARLAGGNRALCHLGLTRCGQPKHPLYIGYSVKPHPWQVSG